MTSKKKARAGFLIETTFSILSQTNTGCIEFLRIVSYGNTRTTGDVVQEKQQTSFWMRVTTQFMSPSH